MTTYTSIPQDITKLKNESLNKNNNLSDLADRAAAWLNVRPIGSTPLAGDPVGDYDAVTKRWVENKINTGTVGPTMNGVMNYGVGDFQLRDSRAYIQPYEVVSDGQLLNRGDWPELWAYAQMLTPISDAEWLADASKRGKYSLGNGTTTFRVPDRNGVQPGSIFGLFCRGDGGQSGNDGYIYESGAPNITGRITLHDGELPNIISGVSGAFWGSAGSASQYRSPSTLPVSSAARSYGAINMDASRVSAIYGRTVSELRPNNFMGVWVIRASGGFVAANTSWSVINGDTTKPGNNTQIVGGEIISDYQVGGVSECKVTLKALGSIGGFYAARLSIINNSKGGTPKNLDFMDDGSLNVPAALTAGRVNAAGQITAADNVNATYQINVKYGPGGDTSFVTFRNQSDLNMGAIYSERAGDVTIITTANGAPGSLKYFQFMKAGNAICSGGWGTGSDERIKTNIQRVKGALKAVYGWRGATWEQDFNGKSFGIGLVAQDVEKDCPEAIGYLPEVVQSTGKVIKDVRTLDAGQVSAAYHTEAIRTLVDLLELALTDPVAAKAQIAAIKA